MPLFKSKSTRETSPRDNHSPVSPTNSGGRGFFSNNRGSSPHSRTSSSSERNSPPSSNTRSGGGFLGFGRNRLENDPSILTARQKVADAERAERDADQALLAARQQVRGAREHVKILEQEAIDDARRAKAKQAEAKTIHKSAKGLGRHGV